METDGPAMPEKQGELVVFIIRRESKCAECGAELLPGDWLRIEKDKALCLECADLDELEFLPRGDAALTRRASKLSPLRAVVVQWSRTRKHYERQGVLVSAQSIEQARAQCEADADVRARHRATAAVVREQEDAAYVKAFAAEVRRLVPGCPKGVEDHIARHACRKYSGRVGRSASAKRLDEQAVRLAVIAHIRHRHTDYDRLLAMTGDRYEARSEVQGKIEEVLAKWER